jgi:hypothetical protein
MGEFDDLFASVRRERAEQADAAAAADLEAAQVLAARVALRQSTIGLGRHAASLLLAARVPMNIRLLHMERVRQDKTRPGWFRRREEALGPDRFKTLGWTIEKFASGNRWVSQPPPRDEVSLPVELVSGVLLTRDGSFKTFVGDRPSSGIDLPQPGEVDEYTIRGDSHSRTEPYMTEFTGQEFAANSEAAAMFEKREALFQRAVASRLVDYGVA